MDTTPLNPFVVYARAFGLSRAEMANDLQVLPSRIAAWQNAASPPKTACKLLALRVAQRRGKLPDTRPASHPQRMSVFNACEMYSIHWRHLARLLDRNERLMRQKYELSKASAKRGAAPHAGDTLAPHEVWYVQVLHHLVTQCGVKPPKDMFWPGGKWHSRKPSDNPNAQFWWVVWGDDVPNALQLREPDYTRPYTAEELASQQRALNRFNRA